MYRTLTVGLMVFTLFGPILQTPASAQDTEAHIAQAQQTLTEISQLLDAIAARQTATSYAPGSSRTVQDADGWSSLFDGATLNGWKITAFSGGGQAHIVKSFQGGLPAIVVDTGDPLSGITWVKETPKTNYEIRLEALKIEGDDFMCGLTFPVGASHASLILGGWGGSMVGISSIDDQDASENETSQVIQFPKGRWFVVRMRVTPGKIEAWLDAKKIVDVPIVGKKIGLRFGEISKSAPLGIATYRTSAAYRNIKIRLLDPK